MSRVELEHVDKAFGSLTVLRDISLEVASGELLALLGPSGSGKSTILRLLAGLEQPDQGDLRIDGASVVNLSAHRREAVLMFQQAYLFPFLTVAENIAFGLKARKTPRRMIKQKVAAMLELVDLPGLEGRYPHQLSGGQQQRVALARALVIEPRVLLLDEPLSNLDPAIRATLQVSIRRIQQELRITTLLVTHDRSEAFAMSDRTAVLLDGRIVACDTPEQVFQRPPTVAAAEFLGIDLILRGEQQGDQLDTGAGVISVSQPASQPASTSWAIRPEHLLIHCEPGPQRLRGMLSDVVYRGEYIEYLVLLADHTVTVRRYQPGPRLAPGTAVFLELPPQHLFALIDDREPASQEQP